MKLEYSIRSTVHSRGVLFCSFLSFSVVSFTFWPHLLAWQGREHSRTTPNSSLTAEPNVSHRSPCATSCPAEPRLPPNRWRQGSRHRYLPGALPHTVIYSGQSLASSRPTANLSLACPWFLASSHATRDWKAPVCQKRTGRSRNPREHCSRALAPGNEHSAASSLYLVHFPWGIDKSAREQYIPYRASRNTRELSL